MALSSASLQITVKVFSHLHILTVQCAGHVNAAHELGAIQTLLVTDSLFRINNVAERQKYASLVEEVEGGGGTAVVFSGVHPVDTSPCCWSPF